MGGITSLYIPSFWKMLNWKIKQLFGLRVLATLRTEVFIESKKRLYIEMYQSGGDSNNKTVKGNSEWQKVELSIYVVNMNPIFFKMVSHEKQEYYFDNILVEV